MKAFLRTFALALALLGTGIAFAMPVSAQETEVIREFRTDIAVHQDASISVTETIRYDFGANERHGIFRDIPVKYETALGNQSLELGDIRVSDEAGRPLPFEVSNSGRYKRIRIGDPDVLVTGEKSYTISYTADRAIGYFEGYDELYWNATGNEWQVPIESASLRIELPGALDASDLRISCYAGQFGSTEECASEMVPSPGTAVLFSSLRALSPGEGLTGALGFPKGIVREPTAGDRILAFILDNWIVVLPILAFAYMFRLWRRKGRDPKGRGTIIPEYDAPDGLSPLEISALLHEGPKAGHISAGIIHLAVGGYLSIERTEEKLKWQPDRIAYAFRRTDKKAEPGLDAALLDDIFGGKPEVTLDDLKKDKFYRKMPAIRARYLESTISKGYYDENPSKVRNRYLLYCLGALVVLAILANLLGGSTPIVWISLVITAVTLIGFAMVMPKASAKGALAKESVLGLKDYLQIAEKDRLKFHNAPEKNPKLFEKLLPYAMVLGVEEAWAKEFADIYTEPPEWYHGTFASFNSAALTSDLSSFNTAVSTNMAMAPGSSSGSGGGGFSGGGGGGGGGGSW